MSRSSYHLVGIGGAGMSALARILLARGDAVSGSDLRDSPVLNDLAARGARIEIGHRVENLDGAGCVVLSAAIPDSNPEFQGAKESNTPLLSRAELLGRIMSVPMSVAVTGTHGKSTTSAMLASVLIRCGMDPTVLLGADLAEIGGNARSGRPDLIVAEVCEAYDTFLSVHPTYAIITNVESDHLDYYGSLDRLLESFRQFVGQIDPSGGLVGCGDDDRVLALMDLYPGRRLTYGFGDGNDLKAADLISSPSGTRFMLRTPDLPELEVTLAVAGRHNVLDALGAVGMAHCLGLSWEAAAHAVGLFLGTGRRLELVGEGGGVRVYDDYGHHPTEIRAVLNAVRESLHPSRVIALFQPHLYSRTQQLLDDFAQAFGDADLALFMEIYGAREAPVEGVTGQLLAERAEEFRPDASTEFAGAHSSAVRRILSLAAPGDVIVCFGAGDITHTAREIGRHIGSPALLGEERE